MEWKPMLVTGIVVLVVLVIYDKFVKGKVAGA